MDFVVIDNDYARRFNDTLDRRLYPTMGARLSRVLSSAWGRLLPEFQRVLVAHWGTTGLHVEITAKLPAGWRAAADLKHGRTIYFAPHAVALPSYILFHVAGEELLHLFQSASGCKFAGIGEAERHVDGLLAECGFDRRSAFDFHAGMYSTRRISDEEWARLQERCRYTL